MNYENSQLFVLGPFIFLIFFCRNFRLILLILVSGHYPVVWSTDQISSTSYDVDFDDVIDVNKP